MIIDRRSVLEVGLIGVTSWRAAAYAIRSTATARVRHATRWRGRLAGRSARAANGPSAQDRRADGLSRKRCGRAGLRGGIRGEALDDWRSSSGLEGHLRAVLRNGMCERAMCFMPGVRRANVPACAAL